MNGQIFCTAISDIGCVRKNNEDMAYVAGKLVRDGECDVTSSLKDGPVAFAVADGMGGYEGGEVASEIVLRAFAAFMDTFPAEGDDATVITTFKRWAIDTNRLVLETARLRPSLSEMGTTFIALVFASGKLWLINIGDSRCYRIRNGVLKQMSVDHSERERTGNPEIPSNLIYNFMGNAPEEFISDISCLNYFEDDVYILCSDGLSDFASENEISMNGTSVHDLLQIAKGNGGKDNITIIRILV